MNITVILCTYNRCESLVRALDSVALSRLPASIAWEVLVVDNNSRDQTSTVVAEFCARYPGRFRYTFESRPGKSYALNKGIAEAQGVVLAFMDDDVKVNPTWLQNVTAPLFEGEWAGCGGPILPEWSCTPPRWLPDRGRYPLAPLALFDLGPEAGRLMESPFGTNMAFSRTMFTKYGGFRTDLGPQPGSEIRGEDSEFGNRLLAAGELLWYAPSAVVYHPVPEHRLRKEYFLTWWFDKGRATIKTDGIPGGTKWVLAGVPLRLLRRFAVWTARWMVASRPSRRFSNKLSVWSIAGQIAECYHQAHSATFSPQRST
jgi:glycosyltransferase involved in cell wall biosynthesis